MSVLTYLENLEQNIRMTDFEKTSIETSISTLKKRLNYYFENEIKKIIVFGSYQRNTNLSRKADEKSDVDILIVFDDLDLKPQSYITKLKRFMEDCYYSSEIYQSNPCAILELNHIKFELTPAIHEFGDYYQIPNKANSYSEWISTRPFYLDELSAKNSHSRYKKVIRLVKYWNCLNRKYFPSHELEKHVLNTSLFCYTENLQENVFQTLKNIRCPIYAPQYVQDYLKKTNEVIDFIEENQKQYPNLSEQYIQTIFKELN